MALGSKRSRFIAERLGVGAAPYAAADAFKLLRECSRVKFVESVDVSVTLGVDPRKSDQVVRGSSLLPHGTGKTRRVAVFAQGDQAQQAQQAGADVVGYEDLAERVQKGEIDFDYAIATPDAMPLVGRLGPVLGPRGMMPNPKSGTVTADVAPAVKNAKHGQVNFTSGKDGLVHCPIGRVDFPVESLKENLEALLAELVRFRPRTAKGVYLKRITVSTTMGPGLTLDPASLS